MCKGGGGKGLSYPLWVYYCRGKTLLHLMRCPLLLQGAPSGRSAASEMHDDAVLEGNDSAVPEIEK